MERCLARGVSSSKSTDIFGEVVVWIVGVVVGVEVVDSGRVSLAEVKVTSWSEIVPRSVSLSSPDF